MLVKFAFRSQSTGLQHPLCFSLSNLRTKNYANSLSAIHDEERRISQDCDERHRIHRKSGKRTIYLRESALSGSQSKKQRRAARRRLAQGFTTANIEGGLKAEAVQT